METTVTVTEAFSRRARVLILLGLLAVLVGCDQATKKYAVDHWKGEAEQVYLDGFFRIKYAENPGAFLSLFAGLSPSIRFWILTVGNGVVLGAFGMFLIVGHHPDRWFFTGLALVVVGGVGNLIDRIRLGGRVIDFLILGRELPLQTGVFNVADVAITVGFLMLVPLVVLGDRSAKKAADGTSAPQPVEATGA
jgi:signal peptidase II